ncbi:histidine phosphatase family protein [Actinoalloteichus sp. AHMU CJ021]|uniref:Broad specificity phosphatase PhoE n=1 Tax=Actinoalloteichus caeruleus DSM 43889 TaxID=1120930 RepID=A0ABT1JLE4_ACTCY|nr:histidine phosphatase family protein [Actinoalloteichus caeruleus]AUS79093.1 histidine phosphatase family protein [Actinoalloteichus sp. AHMU CJ021]MCP2333336.1 Broad specificity phosphatase PhoE [Actinoalloteichus caeruleus DSM 43889]
MTTRTTVHLLRHGEVHNPSGVLYGRLPNFHLSATGEQQAKEVAAFLADRDLVHVVASPLERAQQTAQPLVATHGVELATDERLIEAGNLFEGLRVSVGDGALRSPKHWSKLRNPFRPSWGEPYLRIAHRMLGAVHRARAAAEGHEAVCVSHQLPIWTIRLFLEGRRMWHDPRRRQCSLASLTSLVFDDEQLVRISYFEPVGSTDARVTGA